MVGLSVVVADIPGGCVIVAFPGEPDPQRGSLKVFFL